MGRTLTRRAERIFSGPRLNHDEAPKIEITPGAPESLRFCYTGVGKYGIVGVERLII